MQGCYLIHFESKLHHAGHYLGWSSCLKARLAAHFAGNSARLIHVITERGIRFEVSRLWIDADRSLEMQLKRQKNGPRLCPICRGTGHAIDVQRALFERSKPALATHTGKRRPLEVQA